MLDPQIIRSNPEKIKSVINSGRGNPANADIDLWLKLDSKRADLITQVEKINQQKNVLAKQGISGKDQAIALKEPLKALEDELSVVQNQWQEILSWMPNMPISDAAMPIGLGENDNPIIKAWAPNATISQEDLGKATGPKTYMPAKSIHWDHNLNTAQHHLDLANLLGVIDNKQSAIVSGSRFAYILGDLARIQFAIQQLLLNKLIHSGFTQIIPPLMVKEAALFGSSHFPEGRDQVYKIASENLEEANDLFLVGSSEPTNFSYFAGRTLKAESLPIKVFAITPCFRSEVGSWGKDVKGIKRVHQFDKLEMNAVTDINTSELVFKEFLEINEWLMQSLQLPYTLVRKCTKDAGYLASAEQIDVEVWLPGQQEFMEVGTATNTTDFQARRLNIKYKDASGSKVTAHTVNDTGCAMGRILIAIIDNYQQSDGSIMIPEVLQPFMNNQKSINKKLDWFI